MMLPEGIRRENTKMYEEVEIPPNDPMPIGFEEKPVYISELDEVKVRMWIVLVCALFLCRWFCKYTRLRLWFSFKTLIFLQKKKPIKKQAKSQEKLFRLVSPADGKCFLSVVHDCHALYESAVTLNAKCFTDQMLLFKLLFFCLSTVGLVADLLEASQNI